MFPEDVTSLASRLLAVCRAKKLGLATAESCTGGLIVALLTEFPGSSDVVQCGFVVYSNDAKMQMLGISAALLAEHGAVSEEVARAMAEGALTSARTDIALSVTGIAGPGGGSEIKPIGLVHFACAARSTGTLHGREIFAGDRAQVRLRSVGAALELALAQAERLSFGGP